MLPVKLSYNSKGKFQEIFTNRPNIQDNVDISGQFQDNSEISEILGFSG